MKKFIWSAIIIVAVYLLGRQMYQSELPVRAAMDVATRAPKTATMEPTRTPVPTSTIGYMETALVAQSTADEARRINAQATVAHESVLLAQSQLTAQAELMALSQLQLTAVVEGMTATAAYTSVPLTATQQVYANTENAARQRLQAAQLTATNAAPTQMMAMARAENYQKYGAVDHFAGWVAVFLLAVFVVGVVVFMFRHREQPKQEPQEQPEPEEDQDETVVVVKRPGTNGDFSKTRYVLPCTSEQFTNFCDKVLRDEDDPERKTFAINQWEGKDSPFTRDGILKLRNWFKENNFGKHTPDNQLVPTDDGEDFMYAWLDGHNLPDGYSFEEQGSAVTEVAGV